MPDSSNSQTCACVPRRQCQISKHSLIAKAVLSSKGVEKVSFLSVQIDKQLRPEVLRHEDPRFDVVVNFMDSVSEGYNHPFSIEGDEVVV